MPGASPLAEPISPEVPANRPNCALAASRRFVTVATASRRYCQRFSSGAAVFQRLNPVPPGTVGAVLVSNRGGWRGMQGRKHAVHGCELVLRRLWICKLDQQADGTTAESHIGPGGGSIPNRPFGFCS